MAITEAVVYMKQMSALAVRKKHTFANAYPESWSTEQLLDFSDQERGMRVVQPKGTGTGCSEVHNHPQLSRGTPANVALNLNAIAF